MSVVDILICLWKNAILALCGSVDERNLLAESFENRSLCTSLVSLGMVKYLLILPVASVGEN